MRRESGALVGLALVLVWPATVVAQAELGEWLSPQVERFEPRLELRGAFLDETGQEGHGSRQDEQALSLRVPLSLGEGQSWAATVRATRLGLSGDLILPVSGEKVPSHLWDVSAGLAYRERLGERRGWGVSGAVGSASDRPFDGGDVLEVRANAFYMLPSGESNAWLLFLTYSNTREFLRNVPLPSAGYMVRPSRELTMVLGVPLWVDWRPGDRFTLQASYFPVRTFNLRTSVRIGSSTRLLAGLESRYHGYLRAGREDRDDRLFVFDRRVQGGVGFGSPRTVTFELVGGWAFDRQVFEGDKWDDDANGVELDDTPFVALRLVARL